METEVKVNPIPEKPTITASTSTEFCFGGSVLLTSSAAAGNQWYKDEELIQGATNPTYLADASGKYKVIVTLVGCSSPASLETEVKVNPIPEKPTITASTSTEFCFGGIVLLTSSAATGNQWYKDEELIQGATNPTYLAEASGKYKVIVTLIGCSSPASLETEVKVNPIPEKPTITASTSTEFCFGGSVLLTSSAATGNQWYKDEELIQGATNPTYLADASGKYKVIVTLVGCSGPASLETEVKVNPIPEKPTISASTSTEFCFGGSVLLTSSALNGNQWYKDEELIQGATNPTYLADASGKYKVIVTLIGCSSPASLDTEVKVNPIPEKPTITASTSTEFCFGGSVLLTSSALNGNQWYKDEELIQGATNPTYLADASGKYKVIVTLVGCSGPASLETEVKVNPIPEKPTITESASTEFCFGGGVLLTSSALNGNQWYKDEELIQGATNPTYLADASGKYKVIVTLAGCSSPASLDTEVKVNPIPEKPTISTSTSTEFCFGGSVLLTSSAAAGNQWYKDEELIRGATNPTYLADASGKYKVIVTLVGCSSPASLDTEVKVNPIPEKPTISASTSTEFCFGGSVLLTSSAAAGNQWYKDEELIQGATNPTYLADASGKYKVIVTLAGCSSPASLETEVKVNPIPEKPTISASTSTEFCFGGSVLLTSSAAAGNQWYKDEELIQGATNPTYLAEASGKYKVIVTLISCSSPASLDTEVKVNPIPEKPTITASTSTEFCFGGSVLLTSSAATGNQWYKNGSLIPGATNPTYLANISGKYKVIVTLNTCISPASLETEVTVNPIPETPTITASTSTEFCFGGSVLLTSSSATGNQWYKDGNLIPGATNLIYLANVSGKYKVIVTLNSCISPASLETEVTVNPIPEKPIITASTSTEFCFGGNVLLTSSAATGNQWYKDGNLIPGATNPIYLANTSGKYKVIVTLVGCSSPASLETEVKVNPIPEKPTISASTSTEFCFGGSVLLSSSALNGNQWYKDEELIQGATNPTYLADASGKYKVIVTLVGCSGPASLDTELKVNPIPEKPTITASTSTEFCFGGSVLLTSSALNGNQWYKDEELIQGATNPTYLADASGKYKVIVTLIGCSSPASLDTEVKVNPIPEKPTITASTSTEFCFGGSVLLTSSALNGNQWYKDEELIQGATNPTYLADASGKYKVIVTLIGCSSPASLDTEVKVNPIPEKPTISASTSTEFCFGGSVLLTSSALNGNQWYKDEELIQGATNPTYLADASGKYKVIVTLVGCSGPASLETEVKVNPIPEKPTITESASTEFCFGGSVLLTSSALNGNQWYKDEELIQGATNPTYLADASGKYKVIVTLAGCSSPASLDTEVKVNPIPEKPTISTSTSTEFCFGGSVLLTSSAAAGNQWYKDEELIRGATNPTYLADASGKYKVIVTLVGCSSPASLDTEVKVNPIPEKPTISASTSTEFCFGGSVLLTSSAAAGNQWYKDEELIQGATNPTYLADASGKYKVIVTLAGCSSPASLETEVKVNPIPEKPTISASTSTEFCFGGSVLLTSSAAAGNQWYKDEELIQGATNPTYLAEASGKYKVIVTLISCSSPASLDTEVKVNSIPEKPTITTSTSTEFCFGGSVLLTSSAATGNQWYKNGSLIPGATNPTYLANISGKYKVIVTLNTCISPASLETEVTVNPIPETPTITASTSTEFCFGGSVLLTSSSATGNQWYKDGNLIPGATNLIYLANVSGKYKVIVTLNSCISPASLETEVTVNPIPEKPIITASTSTEFCFGGNVLLTSSAATGNQWYKDGNLIPGATNPIYLANTSGKYKAIVTLNTCSSPASLEAEVIVNPIPETPTITASTSTEFCFRGSVLLTSSAASGNQWYKDGNLIPGATNPTYLANTSGKYKVIVTLNSCSSPASLETEVKVNPIPETPTITANTSTEFCFGGSVLLTSSAATGNQWYKNGSLIPGATNPTYSADASGKYKVIVTLNTCISPASMETEVKVNPIPEKPTISASTSTEFCFGGSVLLTSSAATGNQWYKDGTLISGATNPTYLADASGKYKVVVTLNSCVSPESLEKEVKVNPIPEKPSITASTSTEFCFGGSVLLTSSAATGNQWYKDGTLISGATNPTYLADASGKYKVVVTLNSCVSPESLETEVKVNPIPEKPTITASTSTEFCFGGSVLLTSSSITGNQWYKDGNLIPGATNPTYLANTSGKYKVIVTLNSCSSPASLETEVIVNPIPEKPTITANAPTEFCFGGSVLLTSSAATGNQWYKDGNLIPGVTNPTYLANTSGKYKVIVTLNTCVSPASLETEVKVNPIPEKPTITASTSTEFCFGGNVLLTSSAATGNQWYKDGNLIPGATNPTYLANTSGKYKVIVTLNSCSSPASLETDVTVNPIPEKPTITASTSTEFCFGGSVLLTSSSITGNQWYKDGNLIPGATNPTYLANTSGKYKVIVTLNSCSSPASLETEVTVNPIPEKPTITASTSTEFCFGGSVLLTSSAATGNQWYKDGNLIPGATNPTYLANTSGKYKVIVTLNTCSSPVSLETDVTVNPIPEKPTITASTSTEFCFGGSVLLTSSSITGNQWYKDGNLIPGATTPTYLANVSGKYKVIVRLNSCSSPASLETEVTVNPIPETPTITASTSTEFCFGGSVLLTSSAATGNQWYKDGNLIPGATNPTYLANTSGKYKVIVTLNTCISPASLETEVTVNPIPEKPTITASTSTEFCFGGSVLLTSSSATGNQWYKDGNLIPGATTPTYLANVSGKYKVIVRLNSCSSPASLETEVTVNPIPETPTITASTSTEFCFGGSVLLTSSAATGNQWYKDGNLIPGATNPTYLANTSGKYKVIVTLNTCISPASLETEVTVNPIPEKPTITASTSTEFCFGGSVLLTSSSATGNQWYKDGNLIPGATNLTYLANTSGKYKVIVTLNTCISPVSLETEVTVNPIPEKPTITAGTSTEFCFGGSVLLTSSSITGNQWYKDGNLIPGATNLTYLANTSGKYKVIVMLNTCSSPVSLETEVTVNPIPETPTITANTSTEFCFGGSVILTSSAATGNQWYKDGNLIPGATNPTYLANTSGKYKVIVTLNTCSSPASLETEVTVNPIPQIPQISASGPTTFCVGGSVILSSSQTHGNQWYKDGTLIQGAVDQTYTVRESGKYTLSFTDKGCVSPVSASLTVTVNPLPQVPVITASTQTSFCEGGSVLLTSSATTGNQWYKDNILIPGAIAKTYTASASGIYTVAVTNTNGCISPVSLPLTVTENPYPVTPGISPSNTTTFCEGGMVTLTSSSASGNQWYKNGTLIPNAIHQTYDVNEIGVYTVKVTSRAGCTSASSTATTVTVTPVPRGFDDELNTLSCAQSSFTYHLQTGNINNTVKGGNAVPSSFTWTVNSPLTGARNGFGNSIDATLINTGTSPQEVIYTVTPRALNGGCSGTPFKIKVHVPVCLGISIIKTADRNLVSSVGDRINYTITVKNTGNANHHQVLVNDALTGGRLHNPAGDNGNGILEKGESWIYTTSYILSQSDFDNNGVPLANLGKVQNIATVQSTESPSPVQASAEVAIRQNPIIRLVKTGVFNNDLKTITYTFLITNKGNVTLRNLELKDPKIPGLLVSNATILSPGAATTVTANYTITEPEKKIGNVRNTATATGEYSPGSRVADISGTNANNDDPTDVDVIRYPQAIDDFATTKADVEVVVRVAANDRASLFPLDVSTIEVKTQPANGGLQLNKDGRVVYHPNKGYSGIERFTYKINDANGLHSNTAVVTVNVVPPDLDIPNTFTPNGDGKNDTFQIKGRENYDSIEISIFNRWGDEVYKNKNYKDEWSGEGLNEGTYFYVIKLKKGGHEESRRSWVLIKR
ncbi:hypothetical protein BFS30_20195 [Pedobacter steynii]|uniref:PKD/Chitinase domain-containing protein n=1 Tax=Pedobacter steynii TaxID=430522 RepID=A0A1D7QKS3_9SPHI|nr:hypothetical protein BFS30_20195 [Pedobacter steynii]